MCAYVFNRIVISIFFKLAEVHNLSVYSLATEIYPGSVVETGIWVNGESHAQNVMRGMCHTLNSSLKSLLSSAMRRFISSSSLSTGSGGYFLFVLGERANSGTLWSSAPASRKEGGRRGGKEWVGETGGDKDRGEGDRKFRVKLSYIK